MDELFRLYIAEHQLIGVKSINVVIEEEMYSALENVLT